MVNPVIPESSRPRLSIELSPAVTLLLDHVAEVMGTTKTQVIISALVDALPGLIERADLLAKRAQSLGAASTKRK